MGKQELKQLKELGIIFRDEPLKPFTSFKIGGNVKVLFIPNSETSLLEALRIFKINDLSWKVLGGGTNILVSSKGVDGAVVKLDFTGIDFTDSGNIYLGAGVKTGRFLKWCIEKSLGGAEFLAGVPACLGGILVNNFSYKGKNIFDIARKVKILDTEKEEVRFISKEDIVSCYRHSSLKKFIVLGAELALGGNGNENIKSKIATNLDLRVRFQEIGKQTAGCIFKNPKPELSAAKLIEEAGLKKFSRGRAYISEKHANFIINESCADSADVVFLMDYIKEKVYNHSGILLEEEIERWNC